MISFRSPALTYLLLASSAMPIYAAGPGAAAPDAKSLSLVKQTRIVSGYGKLALSFEPNQGQVSPEVKFLSRGEGYNLSLTSSETIISLPGKNCAQPLDIKALKQRVNNFRHCAPSPNSVLRMALLGSNLDAQIEGKDELPGKSNYFIGKDSSAWHTNISNYRQVQYRDVYPGVDLVYYGNQRQLEHDFIVAPGADPKRIRLNFSGAKRLTIDREGNLKLFTPVGVVRLKRPVIYQNTKAGRRQVRGRYVKRKDNEVGFSVNKFDRNEALVIDPVLSYSTRFGADGEPYSVATDSDGNAYVTGETAPPGFPLVNPILPGPSSDALLGFVSKISPDGSTLIYSTYFGSSGFILSRGIAVDSNNSAYITGYVLSNTLPTVNALQSSLDGPVSAFVAKLNAAGSALEYSTYLGGNGSSQGTGIAVDSAGAAYIVGSIYSGNFPTAHAFSTTGGVFVSKLNPSGSALEYSTRLGGVNDNEQAFSIAVDSAGEAMVTGNTNSPDFPKKNALYSKIDAQYGDVFVTKFDASGSGLVFSTLLGGGTGVGIATNASNDAFVTGTATSSARFTNGQSLYPKSFTPNAFVTRLKADGSAFVYSTFLGSPAMPELAGIAVAIAVDPEGNAYITGQAREGFLIKNAIESYSGNDDAFLTKLDPAGSSLVYSTYLGGNNVDAGTALSVNANGDVFLVGHTVSDNFPVKGGLATTQKLTGHGFVSRLADMPVEFSISDTVDRAVVSPGGDLHYTISVTNIGSDSASGVVSVTSVRDRFRSCTVNNGDLCRFVVLGGRATVNLTPLAKGETRTILIYATAAKTAGDYNLIPNTATVTSGPPFNNTNSAFATTTVRETADIAIASSLIDSTNGFLHYVHTVTNLGPDNAHAVLLLDPLPAHTSFVSASTTAGTCSFHPTIGPYGSVRCSLNNPNAGSAIQIIVVLQAMRDACPTVTNTTSITSQSIDLDSANDSSSVVADIPMSFCQLRTPPQYSVESFSDKDPRSGAGVLNNNGDLFGYFGFPDGAANFIYKNGSTQILPATFAGGTFNDLDQVIGFDKTTSPSQPALYKDGKLQIFDLQAQYPYIHFSLINNRGQIAGYYSNQYHQDPSFIYQNDTMHELGFLPGFSSNFPVDINDKGEVVSLAVDGSVNPAIYHASLYTHGLLLDVAPGTLFVMPTGIDSSGRITGYFQKNSDTYNRAFISTAGKLQDLGPASGPSTSVGINDCGEFTGKDQSIGAFLYTHGGFAPLDGTIPFLKGTFTPRAINNSGQILGDVQGSGTQKGGRVLLTPLIPEKCGSDATIDNNPDLATIAAGGTLTYTIKAANLDTATAQFTVRDDLDPSTAVISCTVNGGGGTCTAVPGSQMILATLPNLAKGSTATIVVKAKTASAYSANSIIMNTATISSSLTSDYLSTAYTSVP